MAALAAPGAPVQRPRSCTVFVGNIPYETTEDQLRDIFGCVGSVVSLRIVHDKDTQQPKGYGFCDYSDPDTAMSAIRNLNDVECNGRRLRVDLADNALRAGALAGLPLAAPGVAPAVPLALPTPQPALLPQLALPAPGPVPMASQPPPPVLPPGPVPMPVPVLPVPAASRDGYAEASQMPSPMTGIEGPREEVIPAVQTEIAQTVAALPASHLQCCLGVMQKLTTDSPDYARALLTEHPHLCYALLHAQLLLGIDSEPSVPLKPDEIQAKRAQAQVAPSGPLGSASMPMTSAADSSGAARSKSAPSGPGPGPVASGHPALLRPPLLAPPLQMGPNSNGKLNVPLGASAKHKGHSMFMS